MNEKALMASIATELQCLPAGTVPAEALALTVMTNNRLVADAATALMTLDTVPQPPRPAPMGGQRE